MRKIKTQHRHSYIYNGHDIGCAACSQMYEKKKIKPLSWTDLDVDPKAGMNKINEIIEFLNN